MKRRDGEKPAVTAARLPGRSMGGVSGGTGGGATGRPHGGSGGGGIVFVHQPLPVCSGLEDLKARILAAIDHVNMAHGAGNQIPHFREAVEALPDRTLLSCLPADVRLFVERELAKLEGDS